jgi:hypothetical protein
MLNSCGLRSGSPSSGTTFRRRACDGLGTYRGPFSAHRYKDIGERLSQVTLAQGVQKAGGPEGVKAGKMLKLIKDDERLRGKVK